MNKALPLLHIYTNTIAIPELMAFIGQRCSDLMLIPAVCHKIQLAAEEVTTALPENTPLSIQVQERADRITLTLTCPPVDMDLSAFNLAWRPDLEKDASGLGLALASRWVDFFSLEKDESRRLHLTFSVEKVFDQPVSLPPPLAAHRFYRLIRPTPETMAACGQRLFHHIKGINPDTKNFHPARLAALTAEGQLFGVLAETESGEVAGAAFCIPEEGRLLRGYGPFIFTGKDRRRMAEDLACHCMERVGRKPFSGVQTRLFDTVEIAVPITMKAVEPGSVRDEIQIFTFHTAGGWGSVRGPAEKLPTSQIQKAKGARTTSPSGPAARDETSGIPWASRSRTTDSVHFAF
ncbi:hypothetical protein LZ24_02880 [Desulfobotulus alkaliphilus]|uniref:Uncharacterized protein n=1 Tax=Desulfobotulus alkaliphilus TaxID=622671 RepID=A0A562RC72_9BACT|nr:hypothetical protein [Desulfobotulus alkaliphilus]TWI66657.1 hypothetical protein LZ24_02880 [Desulfobotulus alkaliphilus]